MLEELEKAMHLSDEVLNNLPINNKKNVEKFKREVDLEINNYEKKANEIVEELKRRVKSYSDLNYEESSSKEEVLAKLKKALMYTNSLSSSYEKLGFDKIIYQLSHYENGDLIDNNRNILKAINIFKVINVPISINDFNYTDYVKEYVKMFFEQNLTSAKIKSTFDDIYWKCPNIMMQIELNLRSIYNKYKSKTEGYISLINKKLSDKFKNSPNSILDNYNKLRSYKESHLDKNNLILDFYNGKMDIDDYSDEKITAIINNLFSDSYFDDSKIDIVKQLKYSLEEYKNYLKYEDLILKIKNLYNETLEKEFLSKSFKKIKDAEHKLFKFDKKFSKGVSKTSVDKIEPAINSTLGEIKELYNEIDSNMFKIIVKEHIRDNSTIFKSLLLICQYYVVLADYFKEKNPDISYKEIDKEISLLFDFIMNPNNTIINNMTVLEEKDLSEIIVTNYKMFNVNIDKTKIEESNIDSLISDLDKIIMNNNLKNLGISISDLQEAKIIKTTLDKNNTM